MLPSGSLTRNGLGSGAALRSWLLRTASLPLEEVYAGSKLAAVTQATESSSALDGVAERTLWGADSRPGDGFGGAVALGPAADSVCGAPKHSSGGGLQLFGGGAYWADASVASPATPPASPPLPSSPPPAPPRAPPSPPDNTATLVASIAASTLFLLVVAGVAGCMFLSYLARKAAIPGISSRWP